MLPTSFNSTIPPTQTVTIQHHPWRQKLDTYLNRMEDYYNRYRSPTSQNASTSVAKKQTIDMGQELIAQVELPGVMRENVKIDMVGDYMFVNGWQGGQKISCRIYVPPTVIRDRVTSYMKNGLLTITMPKMPPQRVPVY